MVDWKKLLMLLGRSLVYSLIVILTNFLVAFLLVGDVHANLPSISLFLLLEGGIFLTIGGTSVMYSPITAKILEVLLKAEPWNAKRQREMEKKALIWIISGVILVTIALLTSAL